MRFKQRISACLRPVAAAAVALSLFASGRGVSASEQAPQTPAPQLPAVQQTEIPGSVLKLTPDEAVRLALENNLGIRAERLGPEIQTYGVAQARAAYTLNLFSNTLSRSSTSPPDFLASGGVATVTTRDTFQTNVGVGQNVPWGGGRYSVSLDGSRVETTATSSFNPQVNGNLSAQYVQPLLRNFRMDSLRQQVMISQNDQQIADIQLRERVTVTSRNVRSAYFDLVGAIAGLGVAQQSLDLSRELLKNNQMRVEVGTMAAIDLVEAQAEVARNEEGVINADARIRSAEDRLRALVLNPGQADFWTIRLEPGEQPTLSPVPIDIDGAIRNALANRTDLAQTRKRLETTNVNIEFLRNQRLPGLDLIANYNTVGVGGTQFSFGEGFPPPVIAQTQRSFAAALRDVFGNDFKTWSLQLNLSYPLGTSTADAGLAATRLQHQQEQTTLREQELLIATAVREAGRQVQTNLKRVEATRIARELMQRRLEAQQKRMTVGLSTTFELFQAQRDISSARVNELNALIDYNRSLVDFEAIQIAPIR